MYKYRYGLMGLALMGVCILGAGFANAADMAGRERSFKDEPVPVFSWSGPYLGIHAGKAFGDLTVVDVDGFAGAVGVPGRKTFLEPDGLFGGGTLGYNWQHGPLVLGIEADIGRMELSETKRLAGTISNSFVGIGGGLYGDLTARAGLAFDNVLLYAKGGAAFYDGESRFSTSSIYYRSNTTTGTFTGWTAGGGIEYAISPSLSVKAEYQYFDFGSEGFEAALSHPVVKVIRFDEDLTAHSVKAGLNLHLGSSPEPIPLK